MEFKHKSKMSIDNWKDFKDDEDVSLAFGRVTFLSTKPNSHKHKYTEEVIREYSPSYLGKFLVSDFDGVDATTHTDSQFIVGYVPSNQEIFYDYDEDGYFQATVDVVISKIYTPQVYKLFKEKNFRNVSVEQLVGFTQETEDYEDGTLEKEIVGFEGIGITILGLKYNPSIPSANLKLTQMSTDSVETIEMEYAQYSNKSKDDSISIILDKLETIDRKLEIYKEEKMAKEQKVEEVDMEIIEEVVVNEEVKVEEEIVCEEQPIEDEDEDEQPKVEEVDMVEKLAETEKQLEEANKLISEYSEKIEKLEQFKNETLNAKKDSIVCETMSQVKEFVDAETYSKYEESGVACQYEDIGSWKNEVLASITDKALAKMSEISSKEDGILDMGIVIETKDSTKSIYD